jgi:hypothetical protein
VSRFEDQVRRADGNTLNGMLSYSVMMHGGFRVNAGLNGLVGEAGGSDVRNYGVTLGTGYTFFDGRPEHEPEPGGLAQRGEPRSDSRSERSRSDAGDAQCVVADERERPGLIPACSMRPACS